MSTICKIEVPMTEPHDYGYHYMVVGVGVWGRADTLEQAMKLCRKSGGSKGGRVAVLLCDPKAEIQGGMYCRPHDGKQYVSLGHATLK